jgi:hypothetical protein
MRDVNTGTATADGFIRGVQLRRRRSRVPWIYSLYHVAGSKFGQSTRRRVLKEGG